MALTKVAPAGIGSTPGDGYRIGSSFLHSTGVELTNANASGIVTAAQFDGKLNIGIATFTDDVKFTGASGNILFDKSQNRLEFDDSVAATFGTAANLRIYGTSSNGQINNYTGDLLIQNDSSSTTEAIKIRGKSGEESIVATADGSVASYYNNVKRLETSGIGVTVTGQLDVGNVNSTGVITATKFVGDIAVGSSITYGDNEKAYFGTGLDLKIYHNTVANTTSPANHLYANSNYIDSHGAGNLFIRTAGSVGTYIGNTDGEHAASFHANGSAVLYWDANEKFRTTTSGATVTGALTATSFSGSGASLTALNGSNISSGTVATARLGSGTANNSSFLRGDQTWAAVTSTTINSNTNNYLITGTGTADTLQGESGLTFNSDRLILTNTSTPQIRINNDTSDGSSTRFVLGKATATNNFFNGAASGDSCIGFPGKLHFGVGTAIEATISSSGLAVGDHTPASLLHTNSGSASGGLFMESNGCNAYIWAIQNAGNLINGSTAGSMGIRSANGFDISGNNGSNVHLRIDSSGKVGVGQAPNTQFNVKLSSQQADGTDDASDWGVAGIFQLDAANSGTGNEILLLGAHSGGVGQIASGIGFGRENSSNWGTYLSFKTHSTSTSNIDELNEHLRIASNGAITQKAGSGDNQFYSQRTNAAGSNGNYFFHMKAQDNNGNNVGELGFHQDGAVDAARFILKTRPNGGSSTERLRINQHGTITNTTSSSHSQGAGTFNIKGVLNQYSQGSGSGLIFDCDFGRLTGYSDDSNVSNGTNLSACLAHSTTDWSSSSSNTPMTVNGGTLQYRVGFGGYMEGISNGGRVLVTAGSGNPAMSDKLNTASMTIEVWCWYDGTGREVLVSRYGSGYPNQFNMICDPNGQFHYNNSGVGCGSGNVSGEHFPDKTWHHHVWQYDSGNGVNRWYINGAFANSKSAGSSLATSSQTGFGIFSRADDYERLRGKIATVRIYNRALSATEIQNHFQLDRDRFGV